MYKINTECTNNMQCIPQMLMGEGVGAPMNWVYSTCYHKGYAITGEGF